MLNLVCSQRKDIILMNYFTQNVEGFLHTRVFSTNQFSKVAIEVSFFSLISASCYILEKPEGHKEKKSEGGPQYCLQTTRRSKRGNKTFVIVLSIFCKSRICCK